MSDNTTDTTDNTTKPAWVKEGMAEMAATKTLEEIKYDGVAPEDRDKVDTLETQDEQDDEQVDGRTKAGREAAKYRRQLRDVEAERDTLRTQVETLRRAEVERIAGTNLTKPEAIWAAGTRVDDLLDTEGRIDAAKVKTAANAAAEALGLMTRIRGNVVPKEGNVSGFGRGRNSFADAFRPNA